MYAKEKFQLYSIQKGTGTPMVLLHGNGESSAYFSHQIDYFSRNYRVAAVDTRGHGKSPRGEGVFTLNRFVEDLKQFLDENGFRKIILLGFSDGGNIALLFALKYPEYLEKLILNGANLSPSGVRLSIQAPIVLGYALVSVVAFFDKKLIRKKEMLGLMVKEPHIRPEALRKLAVPTFVIAGTRDMIREKHTRRIQENIPGSRLCLLEGSHFIANENPEAFNRAVEMFLEGKTDPAEERRKK